MKKIDKTLYTKTEYAKKYGVSRPTIDRYIKDGKLQSVQINGALLIKV
jgi:excisionase family DNA binding protein